jgi:hypothetical protein
MEFGLGSLVEVPEGHQRGFLFPLFDSLGLKCGTPFLPESPEVCQPFSQRLFES